MKITCFFKEEAPPNNINASDAADSRSVDVNSDCDTLTRTGTLHVRYDSFAVGNLVFPARSVWTDGASS
ncbi:MAG: hypothetical protein WBQ46_11185, partial [Terriglobales bacterium]